VVPEPVVGSPPSQNYFVAPRSASTQPEPQRRGSAYPIARRDATLNTSDRNRNPHSDQASVSVGPVPIGDHASAATDLPPRLSRLSGDFVGIPIGSYGALHSFVVANPDIVSHTEVDGLIAEARAQETVGNRVYPQTFVHHALLLRRCRELDPREYGKFFKQLDDRGSEARKQFVNSVKIVYATIQGQVRAAVQQRHAPNPQIQGREPNTQIDRHDANRPLSNQNISNTIQPEAKSRHEVAVQDRNGTWVYQDENGRFLRPARSRNDSDRHRGNTGVTDISTGIAELKIRAPIRDVRVQNSMPVNTEDDFGNPEGTDRLQKAPPLNRRTSVSSAGQMPTLTQGKAGTGREFKGTDGDVETLDPRMYIAVRENESNCLRLLQTRRRQELLLAGTGQYSSATKAAITTNQQTVSGVLTAVARTRWPQLYRHEQTDRSHPRPIWTRYLQPHSPHGCREGVTRRVFVLVRTVRLARPGSDGGCA
jgi:Cdc37 Hsp90 binding domain